MTSDVAPEVMETQRAASPPPLWLEAFTPLDWLSLRLSGVYAGRGIVRGDGAPVVVVPGLFCDDTYLGELHGWLRRIGYRPYESCIGRNSRCPESTTDALLLTAARAHRETGRRVRIIGHSLGGMIARGAAGRRPDLISDVITLGSPVSGVSPDCGGRAHPAVEAAAKRYIGDCTEACAAPLLAPLPAAVHEVNVYTRSDGVIDWRTSLREDAVSIEVIGTHSGLVMNPQVYAALASQLAIASAREESDALSLAAVAEEADAWLRAQPARRAA